MIKAIDFLSLFLDEWDDWRLPRWQLVGKGVGCVDKVEKKGESCWGFWRVVRTDTRLVWEMMNSVRAFLKVLDVGKNGPSKCISLLHCKSLWCSSLVLEVFVGVAPLVLFRTNGTDDLNAYDSDCDDISSAKAVLMANLSSYDSDVFSEMSEQMSNQVTHWEKINQETITIKESLTAELERYTERVKTFQQRFNVDLNSREKMIDSQMDDMIRDRCALKQEIDSLKQTLS
ncbi:hypothetical protein Tco_1160435 [Tanacetum coccineum]